MIYFFAPGFEIKSNNLKIDLDNAYQSFLKRVTYIDRSALMLAELALDIDNFTHLMHNFFVPTIEGWGSFYVVTETNHWTFYSTLTSL